MDYKYIEQLLERYWNCETSVEEEQILKAFFRQKEIPAHLLRYKSFFTFEDMESEKGLGTDFDERILAEIERPVVKVRHLTMQTRFMPLFKAAAMLLLIFTLGGVVKHSLVTNDEGGVVYVYDQFERRSTDPQVAYEADSVKASLKNVPDNTAIGREPRR